MPMDTPGFGWRIGISILVVFGWAVFLLLWLLFYASGFNIYQNLAILLVSVLVGIAVLAASWVSWGLKYGWKYKNEWQKTGDKSSYNRECRAKGSWNSCRGCGGAIYGLGFLGALVYYVTTAPTFGYVLIGIVKALLWPGFIVYAALKFLGA
jgi:hypothetical protein